MVVRAVEAWGGPTWPDIWRPFRGRGIGDSSDFIEQAEAVLRAEPGLVPAWQHFVEDKRHTPSWSLAGARVFWVPPPGTFSWGPERTFDDEFRACAEYVLRDSMWSVERRFIDVDPSPWPQGRTWSLMDGGTLVALLTVTGREDPWTCANFVPTADFEKWRSLFDDERARPNWGATPSRVAEHLTFRTPEGTRVDRFLLYSDGEGAWFQWS